MYLVMLHMQDFSIYQYAFRFAQLSCIRLSKFILLYTHSCDCFLYADNLSELCISCYKTYRSCNANEPEEGKRIWELESPVRQVDVPSEAQAEMARNFMLSEPTLRL